MKYVFVFLGEFGYELFNWQGVIRKFASTLSPDDEIICCSRAKLYPFYETAHRYIDISEVARFKDSVACCYFARLPQDGILTSIDNLLFDRELKAQIRLHAITKLTDNGNRASNAYDDFRFVFSSDKSTINGCVFGADRRELGSESWPDIYDRLNVRNNHFARISCQSSTSRAHVEDRLKFSLNEPYILCQNRQRQIAVRSAATLPHQEVVRRLAARIKVVLLSFNTHRTLDSYSSFGDIDNCFPFDCSSFLEQAILIENAKACVFFTEGDFGSHTYVPPFMGKDVYAVAARDVYELGTTPIEFWNDAVFQFGGKILPITSGQLFDEGVTPVDLFADLVLVHAQQNARTARSDAAVTSKSSHCSYLHSVEIESRRSDVANYYLWPRTPLSDDHQDKIVQRMGVSDYEVTNARSRSYQIINAIRELQRLGLVGEDFSVLDIACGDGIVLWQIQKAFRKSQCFGVECNLSFPTHQKASTDGVRFSFGLIQHLFASRPPKPFDVSMMLNSYRGWESADLREHEQNLPELADLWFANHSRFTIVTATETQVERLRARGFAVASIGKGEDQSSMIVMSKTVAISNRT